MGGGIEEASPIVAEKITRIINKTLPFGFREGWSIVYGFPLLTGGGLGTLTPRKVRDKFLVFISCKCLNVTLRFFCFVYLCPIAVSIYNSTDCNAIIVTDLLD